MTTTYNIESPRLSEIITSLQNAVKSLESVSSTPLEAVKLGKVIQKGERLLNKEFKKRQEQLESLSSEIDVITDFAQKMGYKLEGLENGLAGESPNKETEPERTDSDAELDATNGDSDYASV